MLSWGLTQPLFQLAVTLNFGITLIAQLRDGGFAVERSIVDSISRQIETEATRRGDEWEQSVQEAVGQFNALFLDQNRIMKFLLGRGFSYFLYGASAVALLFLCVATLSAGEPGLYVPIVGIFLCVIPVASGAVLMAAERMHLGGLQEARDKVVTRFAAVGSMGDATRGHS